MSHSFFSAAGAGVVLLLGEVVVLLQATKRPVKATAIVNSAFFIECYFGCKGNVIRNKVKYRMVGIVNACFAVLF